MIKNIFLLLISSSTWYRTNGSVSCELGKYEGSVAGPAGSYEGIIRPGEHCQNAVDPESYCNSNGICSNKYSSGCLRKKFGENKYPNKRVCNSNDPSNAAELGLCQSIPKPFNYTEIRIHNSNWESSIFYAWVLQIFLSEQLHVPVTIGLGPNNTIANSFYDENNRLSYSSKLYSYDAMEESNLRNGNCHLSDKECIHVMPEVWSGQDHVYKEAIESGIVDSAVGGGQVGKISWYIPKYTARRHEGLVSYFGLSNNNEYDGENVFTSRSRRQRLADIFKRPTTWKDYCEQVSIDNCTTPDTYAKRYPRDSIEEKSYFVGGTSFIGYFRYTDANNCTLHPTTCTGHITAPPCTWSAYFESQLFWLNISLDSNGDLKPDNSYTHSEMISIWKAANATKSDVLMIWFTPDAFVELFRGTDYEFQTVLLPEPTAECRDNRVSATDRCSFHPSMRYGNSEGSCDTRAHALQKLIATSLRTMNDNVPLVYQSPAYMTIRNFKISELDMESMLKVWITRNHDTYGFDAREAVCDWVADNLGTLNDFIPPGYPRIISDNSQYDGFLILIAQIIGVVVACIVLIVAGIVYYQRYTRVFVCAQVYFVLLLIGGLFVISLSAIMYAIRPTSSICISRQWLVTLGYTTELVPLIVKLSAINHLLHSAFKRERVRISIRTMMINVFALVCCAIILLAAWTIVDPPLLIEEHILVDEVNNNSNGGENVVESTESCSSNANTWEGIATGWVAFLLVMATILAYQTRNINQIFNESQILGVTIYSQFLFMILRILIGLLETYNIFRHDWAAASISILLSFDVIFAICIYIVPKIIESIKRPHKFQRGKLSNLNIMAPTSENKNKTPIIHGNSNGSSSSSSSFNYNQLYGYSGRNSGQESMTIQGLTSSVMADIYPIPEEHSESCTGEGGDDSDDLFNNNNTISDSSIINQLHNDIQKDVLVEEGIDAKEKDDDEEEDVYDNDESYDKEQRKTTTTIPSDDGSLTGPSTTSARSKMREIENELQIFKQG